MTYTFKIAGTEDEYDQIRALNHRVFAEEIGQHASTDSGRLIDKHESKSRFVIALHGGRVVGMLSMCSEPPFSIEQKLADPSILEDLPRPLLEIRLLAVEPEHRGRLVLLGLYGNMITAALEEGFGALLISAVESQLRMYRNLGFEPLGPPVNSGQAVFVPMALRLNAMPESLRHNIGLYQRRAS